MQKRAREQKKKKRERQIEQMVIDLKVARAG